MAFIDEIRKLAEQARTRKDGPMMNEAVTQSSLIVPFIRILGYDDSDPDEVFPQFDADFSNKKGPTEKADYAILKDGSPPQFCLNARP